MSSQKEYSFEPTGSYVVVETEATSDMASEHIVHCDYTKDIPQAGRVLAVGPGHHDNDGLFWPTSVKPGDRVLFNRFAGMELKMNGKVYELFHERDLHAILGEEVSVSNMRSSNMPKGAHLAAPAIYDNLT